jgi:hypothetical protein
MTWTSPMLASRVNSPTSIDGRLGALKVTQDTYNLEI